MTFSMTVTFSTTVTVTILDDSDYFRRLYETLLPENLEKHSREWQAGKTESEIKLLIHALMAQSPKQVRVGRGATATH